MPLLLQSETLSRKTSLVAAVCLSMLGTACSEVKSPEGIKQPTSVAAFNAKYCSAASQNIKLDLSNIQLKREQNIPLMYQGFNNIEGPLWHDGALYYSNMGSQQPDENGFVLSNQTTIWRWVQGEQPKLWMKDTVAGSNGLAVDSQGNLLAARQLDGSLSSIDWQSKQITAIASTYNGKRFNSPNDLTAAQDNTIYFTDPIGTPPQILTRAVFRVADNPAL